MNADILVDGDPSHKWWIKTALEYLPEEVLSKEGNKLAIIGVGGIGGCRLPDHYREREIILLSDWIFPPGVKSEGDEEAKFFIVTLLHEIAHAICRHKSPKLDKLSDKEFKAQEDEADEMAIDWYNTHVTEKGNEFLSPMQVSTFRELVDRFSKLYDAIGNFKGDWHEGGGGWR